VNSTTNDNLQYYILWVSGRKIGISTGTILSAVMEIL